MSRSPNLLSVNEVILISNTCSRQNKNGDWVPARPIGFFSLRWRLKLAWNVFLGKYDALKWAE